MWSYLGYSPINQSHEISWQEGFIAYECTSHYTSHASNIKTRTSISQWLINVEWLGLSWFGFFIANFYVKSTTKCSLRIVYYYIAYILDGWKLRSYAIIPSCHISYPFVLLILVVQHVVMLKLEANFETPNWLALNVQTTNQVFNDNWQVSNPLFSSPLSYKNIITTWSHIVHQTPTQRCAKLGSSLIKCPTRSLYMIFISCESHDQN